MPFRFNWDFFAYENAVQNAENRSKLLLEPQKLQRRTFGNATCCFPATRHAELVVAIATSSRQNSTDNVFHLLPAGIGTAANQLQAWRFGFQRMTEIHMKQFFCAMRPFEKAHHTFSSRARF
jgi:hypothetical protein